MPEPTGQETVVVLANGAVNGVNGAVDRPQTPIANGMSLTEYSANPTTPPEDKRNRIRKAVPQEYLQEDGHPDVSLLSSTSPFAR